MEWLFILGFALSSSIDNFGVGISYGVRKVRIKWLSNLLIAAICFLFSMVGIMFGKWIRGGIIMNYSKGRSLYCGEGT